MSPLVTLSLRLARAGGPFRIAAIVVANALGSLVLLAAAALPGALTPAGADLSTDQRVQTMAITTFLLVPVAILLLAVGRLASATRDRRLASLRILGFSPARTRAVAAGENGVLALAGASVGALVFVLVAPVLEALDARGGAWFVEALRVTPGQVVVTVLGIVALSAVTAIAGTRRMTQDPQRARSQSALRRPGLWVLAPLAVGVAVLALLAHDTEAVAARVEPVYVFFAAALVCAIGIALLPPLVSSWLAGGLVRIPAVSATLAGRAIQAEPTGAGRLVAGVGVTTFLVVAVFGMLGAYLSAPQFRLAEQMRTDGPQTVWVLGGGFAPGTPAASMWEGGIPLTDADRDAITAVPGVIGLTRDWELEAGPCIDGEPCPQPFIGTCAELALVMSVTGCVDDHAAVIHVVNIPPEGEVYAHRVLVDPTVRPTITLRGPHADPDGSGLAQLDVPLVAEPLVQDIGATTDAWVYSSSYEAFIPSSLVEGVFAQSPRSEIIAEGGPVVLAAIQETAEARGIGVAPYPTDEYDGGMRIRSAVLTLAAIIVGLGLVGVALSAMDRARERQRDIARLVAVGVPARTLRAGQLWQTLLPLGIAVGAASACGALLVDALAAINGQHDLMVAASMPALLMSLLCGVVLVSLVTLPMTRARLTPEMLREE